MDAHPTRRGSAHHQQWRAVINWHPEAVGLADVHTVNHPFLGKHGWFCVLAAKVSPETNIAPLDTLELVHIGDAFHQTLRDRIAQPRRALERMQAACPSGKELIVTLGRAAQRSRKRRTQDYLGAVLRALHERHRMLVEEPYARPYTGKQVCVVNEWEFHPLKSRVLLRPVVVQNGDEASASVAARLGVAPAGTASGSSVVRRKRRAKAKRTANPSAPDSQ